MDICDGDLVRRARAGDAAAFRLLVERHSPSARARAARVPDALMDRLAIPVTGDDLFRPFATRTLARPSGPRSAPRNLAFADGLNGWTGTRDWTRYQITGRVPADAEHMGFELTLAGPGSVWLRNAELARTG